ncbi:helix-turn-helix domain-containing protein [Priestia aryabhattai]|uniref:helix-turn-helix domain-containing protein n=1 Tax=Priestia aryabhattai TaxID=412384 RepID=UPI0039A1AFA1
MENFIAKYRKEKKITQTDLAKKLDLNRSYLSTVESGARTPSLQLLKQIADTLEVSIDSLLGRDDKNFYNVVRLERTEGEKHANN